MSSNWRELMGIEKPEPLTMQDIAHLDALWAQASLHTDDESTFLAGIGAMWPSLRPAVYWEIANRTMQAAEDAVLASQKRQS